MLKRDVEMIARIVKANSGNRRKIAEAFALELAQIVSAFDRAKFLKQCGVKQEPNYIPSFPSVIRGALRLGIKP